MADQKPTHEIISRKDAIVAGLKFYFTGVPCPRGHVALRRVNGTCCVPCSKEKLTKRRTEKREEHREWQRNWQVANREKRLVQARALYAADPEKFRAKARRSYAKNPEKGREYSKNHHHTNYPANEEMRIIARDRVRQWRIDNPEHAKDLSSETRRNRQARIRGAEGTHSRTDVAAILDAQNGKCAYCRKRLRSKYDVDHIKPISKGGSNERRNLQILCPTCNRQKGARDPIFHARTLGLLL